MDFLCVNEKYDTTTPAGRAMMGMVSVFAQLERETTAERIRDNMHMLARTGRWLGGHTPTGFRSQKEERLDVDGKSRATYMLVPDTKEIKLIKFIFTKFIELQSVAGTVRYLVDNNIRTRNGKDFTSMAAKDILRNPVYCTTGNKAGNYFEQKGSVICYEKQELDNKSGFMPYNRTSNGKSRQSRNKIQDWLIAVGKHKGVIYDETWVKVQHILDAKQEKSRSTIRIPHKSEALLSGLLVCGKCGSAMRPHVHTSRQTPDGQIPYYYLCELKEQSSKKRCDMRNANGLILDKAVVYQLLCYKQKDSSIYKSLRELSARLAGRQRSAQEPQDFLKSELEIRQRQIQHLLDTLSDGITGDSFAEHVRKRVNELHEQCVQLKMEAEKASLNGANYFGRENRTEAIKSTLVDIKDTVATASATEKRELLKATVERIVWDGEQAHIFLFNG